MPEELGNEPPVDQYEPEKGNSSVGSDAKVNPVTESRVFRLENNFIEMMKSYAKVQSDLGTIKGNLGTIKWQVRALLTAVIGGGGSLLAYFVCDSFFGTANDSKENDSKEANKTDEVVELLQKLIEKTESPKLQNAWW